jgi:hypothetical protein
LERDAGIEVEVGVMAEEAAQNAVFPVLGSHGGAAR